jgi:hypothetical protein
VLLLASGPFARTSSLHLADSGHEMPTAARKFSSGPLFATDRGRADHLSR